VKNKFSDFDLSQMHRAVELALRGGRTSPNPPVGAVLARGTKVLAAGYHKGPGTPHAEIDALKKLKGKAHGATLYVTLEPCCHTNKRTPPCVNAILESGVRRVVVGTTDPNPLVNGRGLRALKSRGLRVETHCLTDECVDLIRFYAKWVRTGRPFVLIKAGMTLDGKIATARGESRWITGEESRRRVHELRSRVDAVVVGANTVIQDDPELTVRHVTGQNPIRIVVDSHLRVPLTRKIFTGLSKSPTWVAVLSSEEGERKAERYHKKGIGVIFCRANAQRRVDLKDLLGKLGKVGMNAVLVEGGGALFSEVIELRDADEIWFFLAPKILGRRALPVFPELNVRNLQSAPRFEIQEIAPSGEDLWIRLFPKE
jgi:diaminohydroxyphosphoribosylaminopyrimidine deaminase / 5-amino-6-(5-phosphoribosylamino)uracil reductase